MGQDTYFLGFALGQIYTDITYEKVRDHISIPFIKKATASATSADGDGSVYFWMVTITRDFPGER